MLSLSSAQPPPPPLTRLTRTGRGTSLRACHVCICVHERLYEYMYVRMTGCMSTPLYVHVTHTQHTRTLTYTHTHIHAHHTIICLFTRLFFHQISLKVGRPNYPNYLDESAPQSYVHNSVSFCFVKFRCVLLCVCAYMYLCVFLICWRVVTFFDYQIVRGLPPPPFSHPECWC